MKVKLGVIFLILSIVVTVVVFNHERLGIGIDKTADLPPKQLSKDEVSSFVTGGEWVNYSGKPVKVDLGQQFGGKRVYIHLWASWCGPCLNEIPELIDYAEKNKSATQFILVSLDETQEELTKFLKSFPEMNADHFIQIWDKDNKIAKLVNADRLPMTVVLPPDSNEIKSIKSVVDWKSL